MKKRGVEIQSTQEVEVKVNGKEKKVRLKKDSKSIVEKYKEFKQTICKSSILFLYVIVTIFTCIYLAYKYNIGQFGDGPVNYTEEAYDLMKEALEGTPEEEGEDENAKKSIEDSTEEKIEPCLIEDIGLDIKRFRAYVTGYELRTEGENTVLKSWITKGSFIAEIEVTLDESYGVIQTKRNYQDKGQYMNEFYSILFQETFFNALILFGCITLVIFLLVEGIMKIIEKSSKVIRNKNEREQKDESHNEKEDDKKEEDIKNDNIKREDV